MSVRAIDAEEGRYAAIRKSWSGEQWLFHLVQRFDTLDQANAWIEDKEADEFFLVEQVMQ